MPIASLVVDSDDDLQLAFDSSDLAADLALAYFESGVSATLKADGTPVTEADRAVERLFRESWLRRGQKMRSSVRNLVDSVSPIGFGLSTRLTARRSSVGVTLTGGFTLRWRLPGALR